MTLDYDIVIIGGSAAGRYAALSAAQMRAKVALVEAVSPYEFMYHHGFSTVAKMAQQLGVTAMLGIHAASPHTREQCQISLGWTEAMQWATALVTNLEEQHSLSVLAAQGVDVIVGNGQFQSLPRLCLSVNNRLLRARSYLIATGSLPAIPDIPGLETTGYLTTANMWQRVTPPTLPHRWVILGGTPESIQTAQTLVRFGCHVTLIVARPQILPGVDPEIMQLVQAQLEAQGVRVLTRSPVTQARLIDDKKWIQAGDQAIESDEILVASRLQPNIQSLNLAAVGVKWNHRRLFVNDQLQTTNRRIYACGDVIGGFQFVNIANYEAKVALNNALFFPVTKVNYHSQPWAVFSEPMLAQVGLTEVQAKRHYPQAEVVVLRQSFKEVTAAQLQAETTGICKLIILRNGEILGAAVLGAAAGELIHVIALAIAQKLKVKVLSNLAPIYPSFAETLEQIAQAWQQHKLRNSHWENFLETFFLLRRNWQI